MTNSDPGEPGKQSHRINSVVLGPVAVIVEQISLQFLLTVGLLKFFQPVASTQLSSSNKFSLVFYISLISDTFIFQPNKYEPDETWHRIWYGMGPAEPPGNRDQHMDDVYTRTIRQSVPYRILQCSRGVFRPDNRDRFLLYLCIYPPEMVLLPAR